MEPPFQRRFQRRGVKFAQEGALLVLDKKVYPFYGMGRRSEIWGIYDDAGSKGGLRREHGAPRGRSEKYPSFYKKEAPAKKYLRSC